MFVAFHTGRAAIAPKSVWCKMKTVAMTAVRKKWEYAAESCSAYNAELSETYIQLVAVRAPSTDSQRSICHCVVVKSTP